MKKPKKAWKPIPVAVQVKRHAKAVVAARKAGAKHPSKAAAAKRSAAAKKAAATRAKHRKWSPDEDVALCSARAVAESLRLTLGRPVSDSAVLDLYWSVAADADAGISILEALEAAQVIVGRHPRVGEIKGSVRQLRDPLGDGFADFVGPVDLGQVTHGLGIVGAHQPSVILGLDLPWGEPHAVTYDPRDGAWWSWGEPCDPADFPGAVIDEAWAVTWA